MGVPSFFRWLAERYPLSLERLHRPCGSEGEESHAGAGPIDNLYLDLNGIIHPCFHPEHGPPPASEDEVFLAILAYIDRLLEVVRPTSLLYLAVDGPAPRAKMNQQRSRRFKSAAEAVAREQLRREVEQEWRDVGKEPPPRADGGEGGGGGLKDSNIITPGTPFMATLGRWLRHYAYARI
ncbi:hypothetical protein EMIHUDRAFT_44839, partial [Emiliania huxleyi CCMP1516]|uniref:Xrn1 N-terminal domain-containing protein n=2 Tax=Emiliania huxleyi TaxID=2903 RepID=A0A0D3JEP8_EMIH1